MLKPRQAEGTVTVPELAKPRFSLLASRDFPARGSVQYLTQTDHAQDGDDRDVSPQASNGRAGSLWGGGSVDRSFAFRQNGAYRRLKRQSHRLSPFRVYQIEAYRKQIEKQNFS